MVTPDGNLINALLAVASSPLTLLILTLTQIVQAQVNARSSAQVGAIYHAELMGALGAIGQQQSEEMGVFRTIVARLTMILDQIQHGFASRAPDIPDTGIAGTVAPGSVVEPDPPMQGGAMGTVMGTLPISRALQVVRQQALDLSTFLTNNPVSTSTIIGATTAEQKAKKIWQDSAFADAFQHLTSQERAAVQQAIPDRTALQAALNAAITQNAILVLPTVLGARQQDADGFTQALRRTVDVYNERCEANSAARSPDMGPSRLRQAQPLHLAANILSPQLAWTNEIVAAVQRLLHMMPSICLQVDLRQPSGLAHLSAWYWATGDQQPIAFSQMLKPTPMPVQPQDAAFATAQMLVVLLADLLSLGAFEGVSVLSDLLTRQGVSERLQERFHDWYRVVRAAFAPNYGGIGVVGVPEVMGAASLTKEVIDGPSAILLASLRGCVAPSNFIVSIKGYTDGLSLYLAMQDSEAVRSHVYYVVVEHRADLRVAIRAWRELFGPAPLTMTDIDQRLDACAKSCMSVYSLAPERFTLLADAPLETLIHQLGTNLRAHAGGADAR